MHSMSISNKIPKLVQPLVLYYFILQSSFSFSLLQKKETCYIVVRVIKMLSHVTLIDHPHGGLCLLIIYALMFIS